MPYYTDGVRSAETDVETANSLKGRDRSIWCQNRRMVWVKPEDERAYVAVMGREFGESLIVSYNRATGQGNNAELLRQRHNLGDDLPVEKPKLTLAQKVCPPETVDELVKLHTDEDGWVDWTAMELDPAWETLGRLPEVTGDDLRAFATLGDGNAPAKPSKAANGFRIASSIGLGLVIVANVFFALQGSPASILLCVMWALVGPSIAKVILREESK